MNTATDYVAFPIPLPSSVFFVPFAYFLLHPSGGYDSSHVPHFSSMSPEVIVITGGAKATGLEVWWDTCPVRFVDMWTGGGARLIFRNPVLGSKMASFESLCIFQEDYEMFGPKGVLY